MVYSLDDQVEEETELEKKIRRGMKKIEKLDRILTQKLETEREVKRERFALERDFQRQIQRLIEEKGVENVVGSQQLLSLCATTDLKEGSIDEDGDRDNDCANPIFATQIDSEFYKDSRRNITPTDQFPYDADDTSSTTPLLTKEQQAKVNKHNKRVDFIKRNINLASHFNETVALTDEEKKRLEELLADDNDLLIGNNPFSTPVIKDDGFKFSLENQQQMEEIDSKLRYFLSEDEYNSNILGESLSSSSMQSLQEDRSLLMSANVDNGNYIETECGEKVLNDGATQRNMVQRLCDIEKRLQQLRLEATSPASGCEDESGLSSWQRRIDPDLLRSLLDVDLRLTSDSRSICDSVRTNSVVCFDEIFDTDGNDIPLPVDATSVDSTLEANFLSETEELDHQD